MFRRGLAPVAAALSSLAVAVGLLAPVGPVTAVGASPGGSIKRWAATAGAGSHDKLSSEAALAAARTLDLMVAQVRVYQPQVGAMKGVNPALRMIAYLNGAFAQKEKRSSYPDTWFAKNASGGLVTSRGHGNYLMDVTNPEWVQDRARACGEALRAGGFDGCYLDVLGTPSLDTDYVTSLPVNPATGQVWTHQDWMAATSRLAAAVKSANPSALVFANGLARGDAYFDPSEGPTARLLDGIDGGNAQGWIRGTYDPLHQFRDEASWKADVDMLVDAGRRGKTILTMTKAWAAGSTQEKDAIRRYALASFLLGTNGSHYFFFSDLGRETVDPPDSALEQVEVGAPLGPYTQEGNAYVRRFANGVAVVNPTASPATVALGGSYQSLGGGAVSTVTLQPHTGDVLTRTSSAVPAPAAAAVPPAAAATPARTVSRQPPPAVPLKRATARPGVPAGAGLGPGRVRAGSPPSVAGTPRRPPDADDAPRSAAPAGGGGQGSPDRGLRVARRAPPQADALQPQRKQRPKGVSGQGRAGRMARRPAARPS